MSRLKTTIYNSITSIPSSKICDINSCNNTYFSSAFLDAFESSNPDIDFKYILIEDELQTVSIATIQIIKLNIDVILKNTKMPSFLRSILHSLFCKSTIKIMCCGNIFLSGEHGLLIQNDFNKNKVVQLLCSELISLSKSIKPLHAILIKDFKESSRSFTDYFTDCRFIPMHVEPNMIIELNPNWHTFNDYKKALKSKYRVKVNKADKTSSHLLEMLFSESDFRTYKTDLQKLYENTIANANFNAQVLNLNTYTKLRSVYHKDFIVKGYFLDNKLVGFLSALFNNGHLDAHFIGLDYSLNKKHAIYPRILNDYIRLGIEFKAKYINLGRTASEIKSTVGAKPDELTCYLKHKRNWINLLIKPFVKNVKLKGYKLHEPFKIY